MEMKEFKKTWKIFGNIGAFIEFNGGAIWVSKYSQILHNMLIIRDYNGEPLGAIKIEKIKNVSRYTKIAVLDTGNVWDLVDFTVEGGYV